MTYEKELTVALESARKASRRILELYETFTAIPDARADISTQADRDSQELILQAVRKQFPDDALCAEEATPTLSDAPKTGRRVWVVDPIDGTRGFAQNNGEFSVMVALVEDGRVAVGVVLEPATNRLTWATLDGGCWRQDGDGKPARCQVTTTADPAAATLTQSRSKPGVVSKQVQKLKPAKVIETHSAGVKLAKVARGEADLYVNHYPNFHDWDIAAGHVLVLEAGGKVCGLRGQPVVYGKGAADQRLGLLASNAAIHDAALAGLRGAF
jgi:3'(2'), 5'-bisphosphate nucleotidase